MKIGVTPFDWITIILSTVLVIKNWKYMIKSNRYIFFLLFFMFYVLPLFFDCLFMTPVYQDWLGKGFFESANDPLTRAIYDASILFAQFFILFYRKKEDLDSESQTKNETNLNSNGIKIVLYCGMIIPTLIVVFFCSSKFILYTPQWREVFTAALIDRYTYFEKLSYIGVACSIILFLNKNSKNRILETIVSLIFLYTSICIEGKRSIIIFALLLVLIIKIPGLRDPDLSMEERRRDIIKLVSLAVVAVVVMIGLTFIVKTGSRGYDANDFDELYTSTRIDFFRDDRVRLAIYSITNRIGSNIIECGWFQTLLTNPLSIYPIDGILVSNGIHFDSYSKIITSALVGYDIRGVMTPSLYAELISNLKWFGLVVMPIVTVWFSRLSRKFQYPQNILIFTSYVLLQMYDFTYISYFLEFVIIACIMKKVSFDRGKIIISRR